MNTTKGGMRQPYRTITKGNRSNRLRVRGSFAKGGIPWRLHKHSDINSHEEEEEEEEYKDLSFLGCDAMCNINNYHRISGV